jgi:uncharacterized membrane protein
MANHSRIAVGRHNTAWLGEMLDSTASPGGVNVGLLDRLISLVVGAILVLIIVRRFVLYLGLALAGSYLLYRGITGYCLLYAGESIDTRDWSRKWLMIGRSKHNEQDNFAR